MNVFFSSKDMGPLVLTRLSHQFHSRLLSHYYPMWGLWAAAFRPWPDSPLLRQPGRHGLPHDDHIDTELSVDILSTWRSMRENSWPQTIHHIQFPSSWVTEARHYLQLPAYERHVKYIPEVYHTHVKNLKPSFPFKLFTQATICTLDKVKQKEIENFSFCSSPRKSLVKGERFVRYEENTEIISPGFWNISMPS